MQSFELIPQALANFFSIDLVVAQILLSTFVLLAFVAPVVIIRKERGSFNIEIMLGFLALALCVGLGWLHYWVMIVLVVIVALGAAWLGTDKIFGKG